MGARSDSSQRVASVAVIACVLAASGVAKAQSDDAAVEAMDAGGALDAADASDVETAPNAHDAGTTDTQAAQANDEQGTVEDVVPEGPQGTAHVALWIQPVTTLFWAFEDQFAISLGTQIPIAQQTELVIDGFFNVGGNSDLNTHPRILENVLGWQGSVGILRLFGPWMQSGPFVEPKIVYAARSIYETPSMTPYSPMPENVEGEIGLGLDIGWQFASGPILVSVLLGGNIDWCFNCVSYPVTGTDAGGHEIHGRTRDGHFVLAPNLNIFRFGLLF